MTDVTALIIQETQSLINAKGVDCPEITTDSRFLQDLPMDSLDLATLLVSLELTLGKDPFRDGFKTFHSVAELSALYQAMDS
ncbi:phosphopantetheine-binding protein [Shewanella sp. FJAT-52076]|uniref:phosphopantetheine-binding protein n=1 Tax=Shewanella sp. FJAT-52076 TaxID=2864202 RepID=UPI001C65867D|nr:phosphopantetheine-binding protein [Shewanella sp. FJAT-52076]QYJ74129.1 hypothetical protein K0H79_12175 [Shewanella sp. FJAT-52076]